MNRNTALTFIRYPDTMPPAFVNSFNPWGSEYTIGVESSGAAQCKKNGFSQMVVWIESPNELFYKKLFDDKPVPMEIDILCNMSVWYDDGVEEVHITEINYNNYITVVDDWTMIRSGKYDPIIEI